MLLLIGAVKGCVMSDDYEKTYQRYRKVIKNTQHSREEIADICAQYMVRYRAVCFRIRLAERVAVLQIERLALDMKMDLSEALRNLATSIKTAQAKEVRWKAQERARKRHAKDPRQTDKAKVRECWEAWRGKPSNYPSKAAFARDMLEKYENLKSQKKI